MQNETIVQFMNLGTGSSDLYNGSTFGASWISAKINADATL